MYGLRGAFRELTTTIFPNHTRLSTGVSRNQEGHRLSRRWPSCCPSQLKVCGELLKSLFPRTESPLRTSAVGRQTFKSSPTENTGYDCAQKQHDKEKT